MITASLDEAYRTCERTTRDAAANFYYGIRLLPPGKRRAMSAVYAFARRVDDIGDGSLPSRQKFVLLATERDGVRALSDGGPADDDPVLVAVADARERFGLPLDALEHLIDGVEQDVRGTHYETFDELVGYCDCVAGSIGRLCVTIFGSSDPVVADRYADELGVAMQLTNILRDVREDYDNGRVYLPADDLRRFGCTPAPLQSDEEALGDLIRFEAARNREWFDRGMRLVPLLDSRSASCLLAMTGIYRRILQRIEAEPLEIARRRISLRPWEKALLAATSVVRAMA